MRIWQQAACLRLRALPPRSHLAEGERYTGFQHGVDLVKACWLISGKWSALVVQQYPSEEAGRHPRDVAG